MAYGDKNYLEEDEDDLAEWTVSDALDAYVAALRDADHWRAEFAPLLETLEAAEAEVLRAKQRLAQVMHQRRVSRTADEHFKVSMYVRDTGRYDPAKLPPHVRALPGVIVETVDKKRLDEAVQYGEAEPSDVTAAWESRRGAPQVKLTPVRSEAARD